jgi:NhaA family Na+:H+ antiporter
MAQNSTIPVASDDLKPVVGERLTRPFRRFASLSSSGGIMLLGATILALVWANSAFGHEYHHVFHEITLAIGLADAPVTVGPDAHWDSHLIGKNHTLHWWINDFLMAVFFLLVGLEIKRELLVGELSSIKRASLPVFAAIGGMTAPACIYAGINVLYGDDAQFSGWGVPMATDIAFALGILALIGSRVPNSLKIFLTSLAIADDLGALLVIAIFYTEKLDFGALGVSGMTLGLLLCLNVLGFKRATWYLLPGLCLWYFVYESGIHATIAGVLLAATIPVKSRIDSDRYLAFNRRALDLFEKNSPPGMTITSNSSQRAVIHAVEKNNELAMPLLHRMEHVMHPWVAFMIIPIFALANAGVAIDPRFFADGVIGFFRVIMGEPIMVGVILGLFLGKPLGITLFAWVSVKLGFASLPRGVTWHHIIGAGFMAGIGFTMAIFIANLAFKAPSGADLEAVELAARHQDHATIAILIASTLSTIVGLTFLLLCKPKPDPDLAALGSMVTDN